MTGAVSVERVISAPAEVLYDLVADLPRMGRWSPECERVEWRDGASSARPGARFTGHNRIGRRRWSTHGTIVAAERGRELSFEVRSLFDLPVALWSYRFQPRADGSCLVVESTEDHRGRLMRVLGRLATGVSDRGERNRQTMTRTLEALAAAVAPEAHGGPLPR